jgi:hypothetical protein
MDGMVLQRLRNITIHLMRLILALNIPPAIIASYGNPVGYQVGQQFAPGGVTLKDKK